MNKDRIEVVLDMLKQIENIQVEINYCRRRAKINNEERLYDNFTRLLMHAKRIEKLLLKRYNNLRYGEE